MEKRKIKVMMHKAGGNASKNALNYRISLPSAWMQKLSVDLDSREVEMSFDGEVIIIKKVNKEQNED